MAEAPYDAAKRKERYERTKQLKGRTKAASKAATAKSHPSKPAKKVQVSHDRVVRVRAKMGKLKSALSEAEEELSSRRQTAAKTKKENSDGKSTAKEKRASQEQRDKHKGESSSETKKKSSGGSKSSGSVADMSTQELKARVIKIRGAITVARRLLSSATLEHGQLAHSAIVSEPNVNEHFARFQSAERGPSR